ncbi:MAG: type II secretion system F family protein [Micrococcales bacterium]|nr:type II secretion system F family protein [Micrococcales bacterium]
MSPGVIAAVLFVTLVLAVVTVAALQSDRERTLRLLDAVDAGPAGLLTRSQQLDQAFRRTRPGRRVAVMLAGAGMPSWPVLGFSGAVLGVALLVAMLVLGFAGRAAAVIAFFVVIAVVRQWLAREQGKRIDQFISQLPELARLLSNGASAGLGVRRSLELAARELTEPARSEIEQVSSELAVGQSMQTALQHLSERLPSRELSVLVHTLVIQHRAGGALVTALSRIAATLDERKQLRREARTAATASTFSGSIVMILAGFSVVIVNLISPGAIDAMLGNPLGVVAVVVSALLFIVGFLVMRRMTRVVV